MSKGGSVGSQGTTQQARGSFSGNSRPSYGGNQAGGLGSKGGSQSYQQPYRSPYGQGPSYSQHGMRSGFGGFMENPQAIPTQNPNFSQTDSNGNFTSTPSGGQIVIEPPLSIDEQMNSPNYQGLLKRREESGGQDADAQRQLDLLQSSFKEQREREGIRTRGPESFDRQSQEQYIPVPLGQPFQIATNDMPSPNFAQPQQFSGGFGSKGGLMNQTGRGYRSGIGGFF
jgi:hypothetical protein